MGMAAAAAAACFLCATVALIACAAGQDEELTILELPLPDPREQELLLYRRRLARVNYLRARCDQTALDLPRHPDEGTLLVHIHEFVPANTTVAATVKKIPILLRTGRMLPYQTTGCSI